MKRLISMALAILLVLPIGIVTVSADDDDGLSPQASLTIASTTVTAYPGSNAGEVDIDFTIAAVGSASKLGATEIVIHKPDFTTYTVTGTTQNGLIGSGGVHSATYTYKGIKGHTYYAEVTLISTVGSLSDSRTRTTDTVTAP